MATAPGTITDAAPKKKKRSIFGVLFHRKKSKKKDKKVYAKTHEIMNVILIWLFFFLSTVFLFKTLAGSLEHHNLWRLYNPCPF